MKRLKHIVLILFLFIFVYPASSQNDDESLSKLLQKLPNTKIDTNQVKLLNTISFNFYSVDPDSGIKYGEKALRIAGKLNWDYGIAEAYQNLGINNSVKGNYDEAKEQFHKSLDIYKKLGKKEWISRLLGNLGAVSMSQSDFTAALDYYQQALDIDNTGINAARQLGNIGLVYTNLKDYQKALDYNIRALRLSKKLNDRDRVSKQLSNIGLNYSYLKDYNKALEYYKKALVLDEQLKNPRGQAIRLGNIGVLYWDLYDYEKALEYYDKALKKNQELGSKSGIAINLNNLGELYFRLSQDSVVQRLQNTSSIFSFNKEANLETALEYSKKAKDIASNIGNKRQLIEIYHTLDRVSFSMGDYLTAYNYQGEWARLNDSVFSVEKATEIANLEARKENEIREKAMKLKDLKLLRKRNEQYVLMAGIFSIAVILVIIVLQRRKSEKLLLNILPPKIAKRLKRNEKNIADRFDEVSIIFIDIVEFTSYSKLNQPEIVVTALNDIFTKFDLILAKYGLEKIKTIGDSYMAVAGLPEPNPNHAISTAKFALEVKEVIKSYVTPDGHELMFRIGIDTGPVVAGVIGKSKFSYDLWGDAVNTASRMESTGLPNEIQVTEHFINCLKDQDINYEERGEIEVKGKGTIKTYLLK